MTRIRCLPQILRLEPEVRKDAMATLEMACGIGSEKEEGTLINGALLASELEQGGGESRLPVGCRYSVLWIYRAGGDRTSCCDNA